MQRETEIALKNYIWMAEHKDAVLDWASESLMYGDGGVHLDDLVQPGLTPATAHFGYREGSRKHHPDLGMLELVQNTGSKTFAEPTWFWRAADGTQVICTEEELSVLHGER